MDLASMGVIACSTIAAWPMLNVSLKNNVAGELRNSLWMLELKQPLKEEKKLLPGMWESISVYHSGEKC